MLYVMYDLANKYGLCLITGYTLLWELKCQKWWLKMMVKNTRWREWLEMVCNQVRLNKYRKELIRWNGVQGRKSEGGYKRVGGIDIVWKVERVVFLGLFVKKKIMPIELFHKHVCHHWSRNSKTIIRSKLLGKLGKNPKFREFLNDFGNAGDFSKIQWKMENEKWIGEQKRVNQVIMACLID